VLIFITRVVHVYSCKWNIVYIKCVRTLGLDPDFAIIGLDFRLVISFLQTSVLSSVSQQLFCFLGFVCLVCFLGFCLFVCFCFLALVILETFCPGWPGLRSSFIWSFFFNLLICFLLVYIHCRGGIHCDTVLLF
jgi:hypothetical protein